MELRWAYPGRRQDVELTQPCSRQRLRQSVLCGPVLPEAHRPRETRRPMRMVLRGQISFLLRGEQNARRMSAQIGYTQQL
jgi:hypothetical protein